jgi:hypothetical protein
LTTIDGVRSKQLSVVESAGHQPVVPCELPDGIRLVYTDDRGRRLAITLDEARTIDFGQTRPFREPQAYRGQRNFPGWWWSVTTRSHVVYESWLGRHHIIEADRDARVTGIAGQPFALTRSPFRRRSPRCCGGLFAEFGVTGRPRLGRATVHPARFRDWPAAGR